MNQPKRPPKPAPKRPEPGKKEPLPVEIGGFPVLRLLGEGGMGNVYACEDRQLGRTVAIKVLKEKLAVQPAQAERFMRAGRYTGWLPDLFLGNLLHGKTLGVIGAGRIGAAYACKMVQGHGMQVVYYDLTANTDLEAFVDACNHFRTRHQQSPVSCRRAATI